jgi:hypothetical protein
MMMIMVCGSDDGIYDDRDKHNIDNDNAKGGDY